MEHITLLLASSLRVRLPSLRTGTRDYDSKVKTQVALAADVWRDISFQHVYQQKLVYTERRLWCTVFWLF
jgi:hypothetical protein